MRHTAPITILAIVAIVGVFTILTGVNMVQEPSPMVIIVGQPATTQGTNTVVVQNLEINEPIWNELEGMTGYQVPALRGGVIQAKNAMDYTQTLRTGAPGWNGCRIIFGENNYGKQGDYLFCDNYIFEWEFTTGGLISEVQGGNLVDLEDESFNLMGSTATFQSVEQFGNSMEITLFGGFGRITFKDNDFTDNFFQSWGAEVNGKTVNADVQILASVLPGPNPEVSISAIRYRPLAESPGGDVYVPAGACMRELLKAPGAMLAPNFDICYGGLEGGGASAMASIPGDEIRFIPRAGSGYKLAFLNNRGQYYNFNFWDSSIGYGDDKGRITHVVEAPGPGVPTISQNDLIVVTDRANLADISANTYVLRLSSIDPTNNRVQFIDLEGGKKETAFNPGTGRGTVNVGTGQFRFFVIGNQLAMDLNGDGNINGATNTIVFNTGVRLLPQAGGMQVIVPARLRPQQGVNEVTQMNWVGNDINIPSPQGLLNMQYGDGSVQQGMTQYGILFTQDTDRAPSKVELTIPGAGGAKPQVAAGGVTKGAVSGVMFTFDRSAMVSGGPTQQAPQTTGCGNGIVDLGEECDPPGSLCQSSTMMGMCKEDCTCKWYVEEAKCGNGIIEKGEQCEKDIDCEGDNPYGYTCKNCKCEPNPPPQPVCGNGILESGEQCEFDQQCAPGLYCSNCMCKIPPQPENPEPERGPVGQFFYNIWAWIKKLF